MNISEAADLVIQNLLEAKPVVMPDGNTYQPDRNNRFKTEDGIRYLVVKDRVVPTRGFAKSKEARQKVQQLMAYVVKTLAEEYERVGTEVKRTGNRHLSVDPKRLRKMVIKFLDKMADDDVACMVDSYRADDRHGLINTVLRNVRSKVNRELFKK